MLFGFLVIFRLLFCFEERCQILGPHLKIRLYITFENPPFSDFDLRSVDIFYFKAASPTLMIMQAKKI